MQLIYTFLIYVYLGLIRITAWFNPKARKWVKGRKNWEAELKTDTRAWSAAPIRIWMHCASLGEFEQGRPILEKLRAAYPKGKLLLTFFSPSGYEIRKNYAGVDLVSYLPIDTPRNAARFLEIVQPHWSIFIKYEFWFNFLNALQKRKLPYILVAGLFRPRQLFFSWYGGWFRNKLAGFSYLFVQNNRSGIILEEIDIHNYAVVGDPRIDRVLEIGKKDLRFPLIESFIKKDPVLIIGSSWPGDEQHLSVLIEQALPPAWKVIWAPHDIKESHLQQIIARLPGRVIRYSELTEAYEGNHSIVLIDNIGMLAALYKYGRIAYIGGGFGAGIHNTLEPMAFGLPVIFGPRYRKFEEAVFTVNEGGCFCIQNAAELQQVFKNLLDNDRWQNASTINKNYIHDHQGASMEVIQFLTDQIGAAE